MGDKPMFNRRCVIELPHDPHVYTKHWVKADIDPRIVPGPVWEQWEDEWDAEYRCPGVDLEPDRDPFTGSMIPCVVCGMSPQVGGTGCCSKECEQAIEEMYPNG